MSATPTPTVHVTVINWNTAASALAAASAYAASHGVDAQVTIVDNASARSERALLSERAPDGVELLLQERNLGYGAAANLALRATRAEFVCVSNADLEPAAGMLAELAAVAADPRAGLVAPRLEGVASYHARLPAAALLPLRAFDGTLGYRTIPDPPAGAVLEVEQPAGACLLLRTEVWRALAGFDAGFFLWFEDIDLARRARAAGYRNLVVGDAVARHSGGEAFAQLDGATRHRIWRSSLQRYTAKHHPRMYPATRVAASVAGPLRTAARRGRNRIRSVRAGHRPENG